MSRLRSPVVELRDFWEWDELARRNRWTDGLPVAPPTEDRVLAILDYLGRDPDEVVGIIPPAQGVATVEQVAIQCAMAGCLPEHVPVVLAALEAMLEPRFNLHGVQTTTNPCAPLAIVSGPVVERLGFHTGDNAFGGGSHASAAVGRAVRLILWNIGGAYPDEADRATLGSPAKYVFCVAENGRQSPWAPIHVDYGLPPEESAVTVFACQSPEPIFAPGTAERILRVIATTLPTTGVNMFHAAGEFLLVFSPRPAQELARAGYTKQDIRTWVFEHARYHLGSLRRSGVLVGDEPHQYYWGHREGGPPDLTGLPDETLLPMVEAPDRIHILVTGGMGQWWVGFCPGWGNYGGFAVTKPIRFPD
jgi:hypothetical protein